MYDLEVDSVHTFMANDIFVHNTDSCFFLTGKENEEDRKKFIEELNISYYDYYKELFPRFNTIFRKERTNPKTKEKEVLPFWCVFEHEHTFPGVISVAKKRYYFLEEWKDEHGNVKQNVETRGGAFLKNDTNPLAAKLQKELCTDLLTKKYDRAKWVRKILEYKDMCFNQQLDVEYLIFSKKYTKHHSDFGQKMVDSETGKVKVRSDGEERFAPIPVHIKLVKRLEEDHGSAMNVGDTISYIIAEPKYHIETKTYKNGTTKERKVRESGQSGITPEEYSQGAKYDDDTYWTRITRPIIEILIVCDKESLFKEFKDCWNISEKQIERELKKLEEESND